MSERGSFVTEYVYCRECIAGLRTVLNTREKWLCCVNVPTPDGSGLLPIIAGKVGGLWEGEEVFTFDNEIRSEIEAVICHSVRIAVLADGAKEAVTLVYEPELTLHVQHDRTTPDK